MAEIDVKRLSTLHGLENWHRRLRERFGMDLLFYLKGNVRKGEQFVSSLGRLIDAIQRRLDNGISSEDKRLDLEILLNNSKILKAKADEIFEVEKQGGRRASHKRNMSKNGKRNGKRSVKRN